MTKPSINNVQRTRERIGPAIAVPRRSGRRGNIASAQATARSASLKDDVIWTTWHVVLALAIQSAFVLLTLGYWIGAVAAASLFIGREHAQAEYRWIQLYGEGLRRNMPWWGGFDRRLWDRHSLCGWAIPLCVVVCIAVFAS